jgi:hypothetical protein
MIKMLKNNFGRSRFLHISVLLISPFSVCTTLATGDVGEMKTLMECAAWCECETLGGVSRQYDSLGVTSALCMLERAVQIANTIHGSTREANRYAISQAYGQCAWFNFFANRSQKVDLDEVHALLDKGIAACPDNEILYYQKAVILKAENGDESQIKVLLEKSLAINEQFPEAMILYALVALKNEDSSVIISHNEKIDRCLSCYFPELHFFDAGYPSGREVLFLNDEKPVPRRVLYKKERFRFYSRQFGVHRKGAEKGSEYQSKRK